MKLCDTCYRRRRRAPPALPVRILAPSGSAPGAPHSLTLPAPDDPAVAAFCRLAAEIIVDAAQKSPTLLISEETQAQC